MGMLGGFLVGGRGLMVTIMVAGMMMAVVGTAQDADGVVDNNFFAKVAKALESVNDTGQNGSQALEPRQSFHGDASNIRMICSVYHRNPSVTIETFLTAGQGMLSRSTIQKWLNSCCRRGIATCSDTEAGMKLLDIHVQEGGNGQNPYGNGNNPFGPGNGGGPNPFGGGGGINGNQRDIPDTSHCGATGTEPFHVAILSMTLISSLIIFF